MTQKVLLDAETMKRTITRLSFELIEHHKKNLDALSDAQKMAVEVIKNIAQLQTQFVRQTFEEMHASMRQVLVIV